MGTQDRISDRIRSVRRQRKLTQVDLAAAAGISRSHLAKIETGGDLPGREALVGLARALGVSLDYLEFGPVPVNRPDTDKFAKDAGELGLLMFWRSLDAAQRDMVAALLGYDARKSDEIG